MNSAEIQLFPNNPHRHHYGPKRDLKLSKFCREKLQAIVEGSDRSYSCVIGFCLRHAVFIGAYNDMPTEYPRIKYQDSVGVRLPRQFLSEIADLAWKRGCTARKLLDYLITYSLAAKPIEKWVEFFKRGDDLAFSFWMFLEEKTKWQSQTMLLTRQRCLKHSTSLKTFNPPKMN